MSTSPRVQMTKQLNTMYNVGRALGLRYVHTPMRPEGSLAKPHRGSTKLLDIDVEDFLGIGHGEPGLDTLPPGTPREEVAFEKPEYAARVALIRGADRRRPRLFVLRYSYDVQHDRELELLAQAIGTDMRSLKTCGAHPRTRRPATTRPRVATNTRIVFASSCFRRCLHTVTHHVRQRFGRSIG